MGLCEKWQGGVIYIVTVFINSLISYQLLMSDLSGLSGFQDIIVRLSSLRVRQQGQGFGELKWKWNDINTLNPKCTSLKWPPKVLHSGDLKSWQVWISNGQKEVWLQMVWILNGFWNLEAQPFEIWTNGHLFTQNHLKSLFNLDNGYVFWICGKVLKQIF